MKTRIFLSAVLCALCQSAQGQEIAVYRWQVRQDRLVDRTWAIKRQEAVILEPSYADASGPANLTAVYEVKLRWRPYGSTNEYPYATNGVVTSATNGTVQCVWLPAYAADGSEVYEYEIGLKSAAGQNLRAGGLLNMVGSLADQPATNLPRALIPFDWAMWDHLNITNAPFADEADMHILRQRLDGHDADISTIRLLVGDGVGGVTSDLQEHIAAQEILDAAQDGAIDTNTAGIASNAVRITSVETNLSAHVVAAEAKNDEQDHAIAEAAAGATMGGDSSGPSTNMTVTRIQNIPVADLFPDAADDGYGLKYDHATGQLLLGPVASEGTTISNIVVLGGTASPTDVPASSIAFYRTIRPGNLPSGVINVGGFEVAWFDLLGITLRAGTLNLLNSWLTVNTKAYDGTIAAPSRSYVAQPDMGTHRFSTGSGYAEGFTVSSNRVWYWDSTGIHLEAGKTINYTETDPLAIQASTTYVAWTNAGGTHATNAVVASFALLTNGLASVTWTATGPMSVRAETSTNQVNWITAGATADPVYVRISVANDPPVPGDATTAVSNIVAMSWSRPDLVGQTCDTAGQVFAVDTPATARAAANKAYVDAAAAAVDPANWADYPATAPIRANGQPILLGGGWTMVEESGIGVVSYDAATNALIIANNGVPAITAYSGLAGLCIDHFSINSGTGTVGVATNGVVSTPLVQWSSDLVIPSWTSFEPLSMSYPETTNGWYQYSVELPDVPDGTPVFIRAVCQSGAARVDVHSPLYIQGQPVITGFEIQGTNLLFVSGGVTNRISMEAYSE